MSLHIYDTSARAIREFVPVEAGRASIYLCGATVQAPPHIGHIRSGVNFDVLRRWLARSGYDVMFCRNVTDIDDKIIKVSAEEGVPWFVVAERNQRAFAWAYDTLGCLPPTVEPRATGHIPEMITLMERLIERGHAYASRGDVYFDVQSYADRYGSLSNQKLENMRPAADTDDESCKRDSRDFALWKGEKPGEPTWPTPWGPGRPGWHLECSAMATKYLGPTFDIHGGGLDLIFPHHENEIAQSQAAGDGFARHWMHNGMVKIGAEKMSKSLGNSLLIPEMVQKVRPVELRYYLAAPHYRSSIDYSEEALQEAAAAYQRIEGFVTRAAEVIHDVDADAPLPQAFADALDDDLGTPQALAVVHEVVREGNVALSRGDKEAVARLLAETQNMLDVLGLDPRSPQWRGAGSDLSPVVDALVAVALEQRKAARERKDYAAADAIRDRLSAAGITVEDTPHGPRWELSR
ncbi:cysteine--tRNA ligase [Nonomuraea sp. KC401]|uniref:cysteine--tRNA ligase n=1 Tax=unclassified Nonomuraea TaxID=2593643 RepID=UPI0010FD26D6|nr:cysteine--tRNA ligase [Nonomuraea sp. KC401]NBE95843.1 cysteine--tRNA ligase [Nonomuraea sp. K271]TLF71982.1 cysteine--tRNA ligase [Nonomuraea sp. KC401]